MSTSARKKYKAKFETFISENNITTSKKSDPFRDGKIIIFDELTKMLWIYQPFIPNQFGFHTSNITGCELTIDDETNFKTSVAGAAGRAIVGGVLAGGVGAIIGGVTGKKQGSTVVKNMNLIISTSDLNCPYVNISIINDNKGLQKNNFIFKTQYDAAMYWCKFIEALTKLQASR
jgi:hypothetical protein